MTVADAVTSAIAVGLVWWACFEVGEIWRTRRRPVRGPDGRWRGPRRPRNGWGRP